MSGPLISVLVTPTILFVLKGTVTPIGYFLSMSLSKLG